MRTLLIIAGLILLMALVGWISFGSGPTRSSINIETQEIKEDTQSALESAEEIIDSGADALSSDDGERVQDGDRIAPNTPPDATAR